MSQSRVRNLSFNSLEGEINWESSLYICRESGFILGQIYKRPSNLTLVVILTPQLRHVPIWHSKFCVFGKYKIIFSTNIYWIFSTCLSRLKSSKPNRLPYIEIEDLKSSNCAQQQKQPLIKGIWNLLPLKKTTIFSFGVSVMSQTAVILALLRYNKIDISTNIFSFSSNIYCH